jgi:hypothetical protein
MKTYFISGHGNITFEEWYIKYKPLIDKGLEEKSNFILGDFRGTDVLSMEYLKDKTKSVIIAHCFSKPRYRVDTVDLPSKFWEYKGGFENDEERDIYMTKHSDVDIAFFREGRENSGTAKNINRRKSFEK